MENKNLEIMRKLYGDNMTADEAVNKWADLMEAYGKLHDFLEGMEDIAPTEKMCDYFQEKKFQLSRIAEIITSPALYLDGINNEYHNN